MAKIAITCTQPRCDEIVSRLNALSIDAYTMPALVVQALHTPLPSGQFEAILITSRHALSANLPNLSVIAIGEQTASLAREKGFSVIQTGQGDIHSLDLTSYTSILYPCANEPTHIPNNATPWHVYETQENPAFHIQDDTGIIAVFSSKGARALSSLPVNCHYRYVCLSDVIAQNINGISADRLAVCAQPDYDALEQKIIEVWNQCQTQTD